MFFIGNNLGPTNLNYNSYTNYQSLKNCIPNSFKKKKMKPNTLYSNFSLFNKNLYNVNDKKYNVNNNIILPNDSLNRDFYKNNNKTTLCQYNNKNLEYDLDMMKMQLRCDLITQKIYQIQDQVQNLHESNKKDDLNLLKKNKNNTYDNIYDIDHDNSKYNHKNEIVFNKNNSRNKYINETIYIGESQKNYLDNNLGKNNIKNFKASSIVKNNQLKNNKNNGKKSLLNCSNNANASAPTININQFNKNNSIIYQNKNKKICNNLSFNKNCKNQKKQNLKYNLKNNQKFNINKNMLSYNKNDSYRHINNINKKDYSPCNVEYGSYDKYFFNDNNYTDNKYIKYNKNYNNNASSINHNLNKFKNDIFNNDEMKQINQINKILNKNKYNIQNENSFNLIYYNPNDKQIIKRKICNQNSVENKNNYSLNLGQSNIRNKYQLIDKKNKYINNNKHINNNSFINQKGLYNSININTNIKEINYNDCFTGIRIDNKYTINTFNEQIISKNNKNNNNNNCSNENYNRNIAENNNRSISMPQKNKINNNDTINFKININNVSNYSINNNCLNINNDSNKNTNINIKNENAQSNNKSHNHTINKTEIYENKKDSNLKFNHDYSNDDILQYTDSRFFSSNKEENKDIKNGDNQCEIKKDIFIENITENNKFEKEKNNKNKSVENNKNNMLNLYKNNIIGNKDNDLIKKQKNILKRYKTQNINILNNNTNNNYDDFKYNTLNNKHSINTSIDPNKNKNLFLKDNTEKKIKKNNIILCHKFTDNPQHFYTVKLTKSMIKDLIKKNINQK